MSSDSTLNIFTGTMADMSWPDIQRHADENAIVLLPMGVIEEHGPHLCLGTDIYTAHVYCLAVKEKLEEKGFTAVIAPPFYWGVCQTARGFIGSFNVRPETAKALLSDILASLKEFGFKWVFGVNAHGDVEHKMTAVNAFKDAWEQSGITACFPHDEFMEQFFGLSADEPYFYVIKPQEIVVSQAAVWDVHGGDIETATINEFYPRLADTEKAKSLPDVPLPDDKFEAWMFGNELKQLSPMGYLGSPSSFEGVDVARNVEDYANRISEGIMKRIDLKGSISHE